MIDVDIIIINNILVVLNIYSHKFLNLVIL